MVGLEISCHKSSGSSIQLKTLHGLCTDLRKRRWLDRRQRYPRFAQTCSNHLMAISFREEVAPEVMNEFTKRAHHEL